MRSEGCESCDAEAAQTDGEAGPSVLSMPQRMTTRALTRLPVIKPSTVAANACRKAPWEC